MKVLKLIDSKDFEVINFQTSIFQMKNKHFKIIVICIYHIQNYESCNNILSYKIYEKNVSFNKLSTVSFLFYIYLMYYNIINYNPFISTTLISNDLILIILCF